MRCLELLKTRYGEQVLVVRLLVVGVAHQEEIRGYTALVVGLVRIESRTSRKSSLDMAELSNENALAVDDPVLAARQGAFIARQEIDLSDGFQRRRQAFGFFLTHSSGTVDQLKSAVSDSVSYGRLAVGCAVERLGVESWCSTSPVRYANACPPRQSG